MDNPQNWLAFSLTSHRGLFFDPANDTHQGPEMGMIETEQEPKLEDFLGTSTYHYHHQTASFNNNRSVVEQENSSGVPIYGSDLKTIAAGFLRGHPTSVSCPELQNGEDVAGKAVVVSTEPRKTVDTFGQRTSIYRGVTRHRWTGRYEAHLWDNSCRREGQSRKGRQVYLGGYDKEEKAARAYDLAALKYWGPTTTTNFPVSDYEKELDEMKTMTRQEFVASLRRKSSGFSRGASIYRGVTRHHQHGRWQARIGRVAGNKDLYLGTFSTQEEAAEAYDIAAIKFRGLNAVTNFDMSRYDIKSIMSSNLPIGGASAGRTTRVSESISSSSSSDAQFAEPSTSTFGLSAMQLNNKPDDNYEYWSLLALQQQQSQQQQASNFGMYQSGATMDFTSSVPHGVTAQVINGANFAWSNGVFQQQHDKDSTTVIPFATPLGLAGSDNTAGSFDQSSSYVGGNWVAPQSSHYHQASKPNLGFFQTPIYGIE